jgi:TonB family protein
MTDVMLHELGHIKRLDWLTMMLARFVATFYWFNPLVWYAIKRLNEEAENSCDMAVLHAGRSETGYAESLLSVAQGCIQSSQSRQRWQLPVQMMLDRNTLKSRIHRILEGRTMQLSDEKTRYHAAKSLVLMLMLSAATLFGIGGTHPVSAQLPSLSLEVEEELELLQEIEPVYPARAFQRKIEGWAQVQFTVTAEGTVDPDSIEVFDSEPRGMFNTSAMQAIAQFTFKPRVQNGVAVAVPNVQYVFRYNLNEDE